MNELDGKQLSYAVVHGTIKVPNAPQIGPTLVNEGGPEHRAVTMTVTGSLVKIEVASTVPGSKAMEAVYVPLTNFSHFMVKSETNAKDNKAK